MSASTQLLSRMNKSGGANDSHCWKIFVPGMSRRWAIDENSRGNKRSWAISLRTAALWNDMYLVHCWCKRLCVVVCDTYITDRFLDIRDVSNLWTAALKWICGEQPAWQHAWHDAYICWRKFLLLHWQMSCLSKSCVSPVWLVIFGKLSLRITRHRNFNEHKRMRNLSWTIISVSIALRSPDVATGCIFP